MTLQQQATFLTGLVLAATGLFSCLLFFGWRRWMTGRRDPPVVPSEVTPPWNWIEALLVMVFSLWLIIAYALSVERLGVGDTLRLKPDAVYRSTAFQNAVFVALSAWCVFAAGGHWIRDLGLRARSLRRDLLTGLGAALGLLVVGELAHALAAWSLNHFAPGAVEAWADIGSTAIILETVQSESLWSMVLRVLVVIVLAPVGEEVLFRGLVYPAVRREAGVPAACLLSGMAFAVVHMSPVDFAALTLVGATLAWLYERTGTLWPCIVAHALNNVASLALLVYFPQLHP